jgi:hypothetical protein
MEHEFKIGDWLITSKLVKHLVQVAMTYRGYYRFTNGESTSIEYADKNYRKWNILDARSGDILSTDGFTFIFKNIDTDNNVHYYCANEHELHEGDETTFHIAAENSIMGNTKSRFTNYRIATEAEKQDLFNKMEKQGYEWSTMTLQLSRIDIIN